MPAALTYVGHATVLVDLDGVRLLTDPILRPRVMHLRRATPVPAAALRGLDAVLVSHAHWDHLDVPSLERLGRDLPIVCGRGLGGLLRKKRFDHVVEVEVGEDVQIGGLTITATLADHEGSRGPLLARADPIGFVIAGSQRIYFPGDTDLFEGMADLVPLDVALLPVWGWGPSLGPGHLDPGRAAEALSLLRPRVAIPIHWGTLAPIGMSPDADPPHAFVRAAALVAPDVDVRVLQPGDSIDLED